jgi:hypothetical protein
MTGYTVHTGSNDKFRSGWDNIFQGGSKKTAAKKSVEKPVKATATAGKKKAAKKGR